MVGGALATSLQSGRHRLTVQEHFAVPRQARQPRLDRRRQFRDVVQKQRAAPRGRDGAFG